MSSAKPCDKITPKDLAKHPVWTFDLDNEALPGRDETWMVPVLDLPARSLLGCGCLANASLACGRKIDAMLWNIDLKKPQATELLVSIALWLDKKWWHLSDRTFPGPAGTVETHRPTDLADKLGLKMEDVFPICYDISGWVTGPEEIIRSSIPAERRKLTMQERITLSLRQR